MATNSHSGYPLKWFKDQNAARNSFECAICLEVLEDPVQVRDCGHQFCALCIDDILTTDPRCPSCRITISTAMVFEDHAARRLIKKLDVNCCNEGCSWVGNLSSLLETHMNNCNFLVNNDSGNNTVKQSNVEKLEMKLESLQIEVATLKEMYENDLKERDEELKKLKDQVSFFGTFTPVPPTSVQSLQQLTHNPTVTIALKIPNFIRKLNQANFSNSHGKVVSDPFYSSHGYKMKIIVCLNEGPHGYTGYMGIFLHLMQGNHDDSLKWPFDKRITFIVVDQQNNESQVHNLEKCLTPGGEKEFHRPSVASIEGRGFRQFMLHSTLRSRQYVRNGTVCFAVAIEP